MKNILCVSMLLIFPVVLLGQVPTSTAAQRAEMKKLEWIIGNWKGTGWAEMGPEGRKEFTRIESVENKLDGAVFVIDSRGVREDGSKLFTELAFVSYDERTKTFHWHAFTGEGRLTDAKMMVGAEMLQWEFQSPELGRLRHTRTRNKKGECVVVGEREENHAWHKLIEYKLRRQL